MIFRGLTDGISRRLNDCLRYSATKPLACQASILKVSGGVRHNAASVLPEMRGALQPSTITHSATALPSSSVTSSMQSMDTLLGPNCTPPCEHSFRDASCMNPPAITPRAYGMEEEELQLRSMDQLIDDAPCTSGQESMYRSRTPLFKFSRSKRSIKRDARTIQLNGASSVSDAIPHARLRYSDSLSSHLKDLEEEDDEGWWLHDLQLMRDNVGAVDKRTESLTLLAAPCKEPSQFHMHGKRNKELPSVHHAHLRTAASQTSGTSDAPKQRRKRKTTRFRMTVSQTSHVDLFDAKAVEEASRVTPMLSTSFPKTHPGHPLYHTTHLVPESESLVIASGIRLYTRPPAGYSGSLHLHTSGDGGKTWQTRTLVRSKGTKGTLLTAYANLLTSTSATSKRRRKGKPKGVAIQGEPNLLLAVTQGPVASQSLFRTFSQNSGGSIPLFCILKEPGSYWLKLIRNCTSAESSHMADEDDSAIGREAFLGLPASYGLYPSYTTTALGSTSSNCPKVISSPSSTAELRSGVARVHTRGGGRSEGASETGNRKGASYSDREGALCRANRDHPSGQEAQSRHRSDTLKSGRQGVFGELFNQAQSKGLLATQPDCLVSSTAHQSDLQPAPCSGQHALSSSPGWPAVSSYSKPSLLAVPPGHLLITPIRLITKPVLLAVDAAVAAGRRSHHEDDEACHDFSSIWSLSQHLQHMLLVYETSRTLHSFQLLWQDKQHVLQEPDVLILASGTEIMYCTPTGWVPDLLWQERLEGAERGRAAGWDWQAVMRAAIRVRKHYKACRVRSASDPQQCKLKDLVQDSGGRAAAVGPDVSRNAIQNDSSLLSTSQATTSQATSKLHEAAAAVKHSVGKSCDMPGVESQRKEWSMSDCSSTAVFTLETASALPTPHMLPPSHSSHSVTSGSSRVCIEQGHGEIIQPMTKHSVVAASSCEGSGNRQVSAPWMGRQGEKHFSGQQMLKLGTPVQTLTGSPISMHREVKTTRSPTISSSVHNVARRICPPPSRSSSTSTEVNQHPSAQHYHTQRSKRPPPPPIVKLDTRAHQRRFRIRLLVSGPVSNALQVATLLENILLEEAADAVQKGGTLGGSMQHPDARMYWSASGEEDQDDSSSLSPVVSWKIIVHSHAEGGGKAHIGWCAVDVVPMTAGPAAALRHVCERFGIPDSLVASCLEASGEHESVAAMSGAGWSRSGRMVEDMPTEQLDSLAKTNTEMGDRLRGNVSGDRKGLLVLYGPHALLKGLSTMGLF
ncbi:hypothetical protein CEUSTIGMA_g8047.t1 [Chlamydomonas eustigma]|uniref:Sucrose phosphatase-like domain-containing protein n=1 Tax=Chlamydomonas eustigma TaxID=1157962 RepID=A0A250XCK5_9CHLO|nr:hypothetical protein CEUSTIGMA_g8047.t1 [Chlamydomonas eustigma]|eukprot:GAX80612.1 hypothetical protein CEUSTIGMA_g8047.t1 [Chlamydomonas eustigma]